MNQLRLVATLLAAVFALQAGPAEAAPTAGAGSHGSAVSVTLQKIYQTAYDEAYSRHAILQRDGTTYVSTGDIGAEWLRDASATMMPYIGLSQTDPYVHSMLQGTVARQ